MIICQICAKQYTNNKNGRFTDHLQNDHNTSLEDYIVLTEYNGIEPKCQCGYCNDRPQFYRGSFKKKANGHTSQKWIRQQYIELYGFPICKECGKETGFHRKDPIKKCKKCSFKNTGFANPKNQQIIKEAVQKKYNVDNVFQLESVKQKIKESLKYRIYPPLTDSWKKNIGTGSKKKWQDDNYKEKTSAAIKAAMQSPEFRKRRSEIAKELWKDPAHAHKVVTGWIKKSKNRLSKLHVKIRDYLKLTDIGFRSEQVIARYVCDELNEEKKIIVEVNGDYVHANPLLYESTDLIRLPGSVYTAEEKWKSDKKKIDYLESIGYTVIVIWESDNYDEKLKQIKELINETSE